MEIEEMGFQELVCLEMVASSSSLPIPSWH
jgi:hypothetical protein